MAAKSAHDHQHEELSCLVIKAQNGDKLIREQLIKEYRPFYLRAASQVAKNI